MNELGIRLNKLKSLREDVDSILLFGEDPNFFYFTNSYADESFFYDFSKPRIITTPMGEVQARASWIRKIEVIDVTKKNKKFLDMMLESARGVVGVNKKNIPASLFYKISKRAKIRDISEQLDDIRAVKTKYEIMMTKKSCAINKKVFEKSEKEIRNGITEQELCGLIEYETRRLGAKPLVIVAFGKNTASPHHEVSDKKLSGSEPVVIDLVCRYKGYHSDVTRTYRSKLESRLRSFFPEIEEMIKPGAKAKELDIFVRNKMGKDSKFFTTSLGHGIGTAVHEKPWIYMKSKDILKENMVFAVEPGLYLKKYGARVENDFLVTKRGAENLTDF